MQSATKSFHIPSLDGIRALSFLLVFLSHAGLDNVVPGLFGVAVFFFLSGYLITTLMRLEIESTGTLSLRNFFLRRALRILPPFYLVVALLILVVRLGWLPGSLSGADLLVTLLYLTNYWNIFVHQIHMPGFNIFWSLSVEEHFYIVFPFAMLLMTRLGWTRYRQAALLVAVCALVLAWRCQLVYHAHVLSHSYGGYGEPLRTWFSTDTRIDSILFGCVLALVGNPALDKGPKASWLAAGVGVAVLVGTFVYRNPEFRETWRYTLQAMALFPLFILAIRAHAHPVLRWLEAPALRVVGVLSYTLYLVHYPALMLANRWTSHRVPAGAMAFAMALAFAWAMHQLVEQPLARLRRRWRSAAEQTRLARRATELCSR
jgi:peptidoglycan/LPS O-acetylase OafA/YrhL